MEIATLPTSFQKQPSFTQASLEMDERLATAIFRMKPYPRPCFTPELLSDIHAYQHYLIDLVTHDVQQQGYSPWEFTVLTSSDPAIFNLGGDLSRFIELIEHQDRDALMEYAIACIDSTYAFHAFDLQPITSIALVTGNAQGGGFEAALACDVIIAERGAHMGFPEVLFNLFPGMGAYSFLSRKVGPSIAKRLIYSGDLYSAEALYELGVVDVLAEPGESEITLINYIRTARRRSNAHKLFHHIDRTTSKVPYDELLSITTQWVDAALSLRKGELNIMRRIVRAQNKRGDHKAPDDNKFRALNNAT
jgi:DSF synthase